MSKTLAIPAKFYNEGCVLLEHQRDIVAGFISSVSANHLPVLPRSTKAILSLLVRCFICQTIDNSCKSNDNNLNLQKIALHLLRDLKQWEKQSNIGLMLEGVLK